MTQDSSRRISATGRTNMAANFLLSVLVLQLAILPSRYTCNGNLTVHRELAQDGSTSVSNLRNDARLQESLPSLPPTVTENDVLRSLYTWTSGSGWTDSSGWLQAGPSHCTWKGITCTTVDLDGTTPLSDPVVERIELSGNNLKGNVPLSILLRLGHLRVLKLDGNALDFTPSSKHETELFGPDYHEGGAGPIKSPLQLLDLSHADLGESMALDKILFQTPSGRDVQMPFLTDLYLSGSHMKGKFPQGIFKLVGSLERLVLDLNDLSGDIPPEIGNFEQLRYLSMRDNEFVGKIPESVGQLRKLRFLVLRGNSLTGTMPAEISSDESMPFLEHLDLSRQRFDDRGFGLSSKRGLTGTLPSFSSQSNLRQLDLSFNSISGPVPPDFLSAVNPKTFDYAFLGSNGITGVVPAYALVRLPADSVFLEDNMITGLDDPICAPSRGGAVASFKCAAILCPPGSYGPGKGRQEDASGPCRDCPSAKYWGASECVAGPGSGPPPTPEPTAVVKLTETEILLKFYESTGGPNWSKNYGWSDAAQAGALDGRKTAVSSFCSWYGVSCFAGAPGGVDSVFSISLENNNLVGNPPKELFQLKNLRSLLLAENTIEIDFDGIVEARSLSTLDLRDTALYDVTGISAISDTLKELHLDSNVLTSSAMGELFELTELEELSLDYCALDGQIPDAIGKLTKLISFSASDNYIIGSLPQTITQLKDLTTLRLRSNELSGPLPLSLSEMTSLSVLDLSRQRSSSGGGGITGTLPDFSKLSALSRLDLSENSLAGPIPENFLSAIAKATSPPSWEFADLSSNSLTGTVPAIIASIPNVYLKNNKFTAVDPAVCKMTMGMPTDQFGCDAMLCSPGTYNSLGRQQSFDNPCVKCTLSGGAQFYGSTTCTESIGGVPVPTPEPASVPVATLTDGEILRKIYIACEGTKWTDSTNWLVTDALCTWKGITCSSDGAITDITLRSNHLVGTFPAKEVFSIKTLQSLVLEGNSIEFSFEGIENAVSLTALDLTQTNLDSVDGIGLAPALTDVFLTSNSLRGAFPADLLKLKSLQKISLAFNALSGTLPDNLFSAFQDLKFIDFNQNKLSGNIPLSIGQATKLGVLLMASNDLSGEIPLGIGGLTQLMFLDLSAQNSHGRKGLEGKVPSLSDLNLVKRVDLNSNSLTGSIPTDFLRTADPGEDFDYIDLSGNQLSGEVPGILAKFPVDTMYLADNKITAISQTLCDPALGVFQVEFGCNALLCPPKTYNEEGRQLTNAENCDACPTAEFYGSTTCSDGTAKQPTPSPTPEISLPPVVPLGEYDILTKFYDACGGPQWTRNDNWKKGTDVCSWFGVRCMTDGTSTGKVVSIMLSSNNLIGTPPKELFQLPNLESLVLDNNKILFNFDGIMHARKLLTIDLSSTGLFNVVGIRFAYNLKELLLASNSLEGAFPTELLEIKSLEQLSLDFNRLRGTLPSEIGDLTSLKLFSCASNQLTGVLPETLGALTSLLTLRLQNNAFEGRVPAALDRMYSLMFLDLSHQVKEIYKVSDSSLSTETLKKTMNQGFTGALPSLSILEKLRRVDLSSNSFSGPIPEDFLSSVSTVFEYADLSSNQLTGTIPSDLSRLGNTIYLQNNRITDIDVYCSLLTSDSVTEFGCDAVLCPPATYTSTGRQEANDSECVACEWAMYYGTTECTASKPASGSDTPIPAQTSPAKEKEILKKLYDACDGYNWDDNKNWESSGTSFCNWKGIRCVQGGGETVQEINLGANNLVGTPPKELFDLPNLKTIAMYSNPLNGFDFTGIEKATRLKEMYLDQTGLKSIAGIGKSPSLTTLNLRFNNLAGNFPAELLQIKTLRSLTLSYNQLEGPLPTTVAMKNLETLIISSNSFQGKLEGVVFPPSLRILDLSKNELTGSVPMSFLDSVPDSAELDVDLSENLLTGTVPSSLARFDKMNLFLANNFIEDMSDVLCYKSKWNDADVGKYGCYGLLCPKGTFAPNGRQTSDSKPCVQCPNGMFIGMSRCEGVEYRNNAAGCTGVAVAVSLTALASGACLAMEFA